ncbi:MAG: GDP-L-fucose synthase [Thaumarchaeota archaeon]|nr:GDP-L-fucose synthase [Nitrososphaerota archaeon]
MDWSNKTVLVTGGNGFLGSHVVKALKNKGAQKIIVPSSKQHDLRIKENCHLVTKDVDYVFHIAAHVGGIGLNKEIPGELFYDNLIMGTHLMEEARKNGVEKFISLGTICSYPKLISQPISEDSLWAGYPEEITASYGLAKKMQLVQSMAYKQQYGFNSITVFVTNLFGPGDNFEDSTSHVVPSLIKKVWQAKKNNKKYVSVWGDGTPTRDFLYVNDAANGLILAAEKYNKTDPINLGTGIEISIKELVELIMKIMGTKLEIIWETNMPNGQPRRCISTERAIREIGFKPEISLEGGLSRTIAWYETNLAY